MVARKAYHHGDLANALVEASVELARAGGPPAVVLREAARRVGVSATSAYRHFTNHHDLLAAVKVHAQRELAAAMTAEVAAVDTTADPPHQALARLHAAGRGYLRFAQTEPGWFRAAFTPDIPTPSTSESFRLLADALDELVACGLMPADRRDGAETAVWATVHGLAELMIDGPLSGLDETARAATIDRTQQFITHSLIA
nr:TetR/AcrR family transcriptional regulator [Kibdelosporangium sp. MJ126-NF4]